MAALSELPLRRGDHIQIVAARPHALAACHVIGDIQSVWFCGASLQRNTQLAEKIWKLRDQVGEERFLKMLFLDSFFTNQLSKLHHRQDADQYRLTSAYANTVMNDEISLLYPSARAPGALNLAARPRSFDQKVEVIWTEVLEVLEALGYGMYRVERKRFSCDFDPSGNIAWDSKKVVDGGVVSHTGESVPAEYVGWRFPIGHAGIILNAKGVQIPGLGVSIQWMRPE
jgi:hypothetical protein